MAWGKCHDCGEYDPVTPWRGNDYCPRCVVMQIQRVVMDLEDVHNRAWPTIEDIVENHRGVSTLGRAQEHGAKSSSPDFNRMGISHREYNRWLAEHQPRSVGWRPGCECDAGVPVPCTVLDPFMGPGTVGVVATTRGRRFVGFEINDDYARMASDRIAEATRQARLGFV